MRVRAWIIVFAITLIGFAYLKFERVGDANNGKTLVPTGQWVRQTPDDIVIPARPVDMVLSTDGRYAYVKENAGLTVVDLDARKVVQRLSINGGASYTGIALSPSGKQLLYTGAGSVLHVLNIEGDTVKEGAPITLPPVEVSGASYPCGVIYDSPTTALVCLSRDNSIVKVDLEKRMVAIREPVEAAPYSVAILQDGRVAVSCWGRKAPKGKTSSDTKVAVDKRGIGTGGCAVLLRMGEPGRAVLPLGQQPTDIVARGQSFVTACSSSSEIYLNGVVQKPITLGKGDAPNALSKDGSKPLLIASGGRNSIIRVDAEAKLTETETPWYPTAVAYRGDEIVVACAKGIGSRGGDGNKGRNVYQYSGTVSIIRKDAPWKPVSIKPSSFASSDSFLSPSGPIKHVVYVIKENRTYDQVFGDLKQGNGDPSLCTFPRQVTPNHHALAEQFVLLDNYYCNGVNSADGHAWTTEANATTHFERSFGGWTRSYPFGDDPLATSATGYIWDSALDHGLTVRNFGEFDYAETVPSTPYSKVLEDFLNEGKVPRFSHNIGVDRISKISHSTYPGWGLGIPDIVRASIFIKEMNSGRPLADLTILYLPQDHTSGGAQGAPSPKAHVADNDLALGRCIEALSKSKDWASTCVFVIEDDPQDGWDHVDGHRSLCLVLSPYTRRGTVIRDFYNQTSVMRTIEQILGLPPLNRFDAESNLMRSCFVTKPDLRPYIAEKNTYPLTETNKKQAKRLDLSKPDAIDDEEMNRQVWAACMPGRDYPGGD